MKGIVAIVLAAGESKRMGMPKMLLDFGGKTMIERVIDNVQSPEIDEIIVVLGAYGEKIKEKLQGSSLIYSYNKSYTNGMLSSVICGVRSVPEDTDAILVFQGDQPYITQSVISEVIATFGKTGKGIVIPLYNGKRGHPLLIGSKYFGEIEGLDSSEGLRALARIHADDLCTVETDEPGILRDFDTIEEYNSVNYKSN
jgi:molybdenum cofactor cytidylyltransferase